jgi:hypothetical protein
MAGRKKKATGKRPSPTDNRGKSTERLREEARIRMAIDNRPWGAPLPKGWTKVASRSARRGPGEL